MIPAAQVAKQPVPWISPRLLKFVVGTAIWKLKRKSMKPPPLWLRTVPMPIISSRDARAASDPVKTLKFTIVVFLWWNCFGDTCPVNHLQEHVGFERWFAYEASVAFRLCDAAAEEDPDSLFLTNAGGSCYLDLCLAPVSHFESAGGKSRVHL